MTGTLRVKDFMVGLEHYPTVGAGATVLEAVAALRQSFRRVGGVWYGPQLLVVLDEGGRPSGLLTLRALLHAVGIKDLCADVWFRSEAWSWYALRQLRPDSTMRVREVMRPVDAVTVGPEDSLETAALRMLDHGVSHLPVTAGNGVVGILRVIDLLPYIESLL